MFSSRPAWSCPLGCSRFLFLLIAVTMSGMASAHDLGVIGPVYPIAEPHLLEVILSKLREASSNGDLARLQHDAQERIKRETEQPAAIKGIRKTLQTRTFYFDPSIAIDHPITDAEGRIVIAAGTRVNPLDVVSLSKPLLFIDAREKEQVERASTLLTTQSHIKVILTGGSYMELMRRWQRAVYFDQQGVLTTKLGIRHVPAIVTQDGKRLRIDEMP